MDPVKTMTRRRRRVGRPPLAVTPTRKPIAAAAATKPRWLTYSTVTSTVAFAVSIAGFYLTWLRESHTLELQVVGFVVSDRRLETDVVLLNKGNRTETVLSIGMNLSSPSGMAGVDPPTAPQGPFTLKPGDVIPVKLVYQFSPKGREHHFAMSWRFEYEKAGKYAKVAADRALADAVISTRVNSPQTGGNSRNVSVGVLIFERAGAHLSFDLDRTVWGPFHNLLSREEFPRKRAPREEGSPPTTYELSYGL